MGNINIDDETLEMWQRYYETFDKNKYPSLKNFTVKKLREILEKENNKKGD